MEKVNIFFCQNLINHATTENAFLVIIVTGDCINSPFIIKGPTCITLQDLIHEFKETALKRLK
jgi:hypothetical protein